MRRVKKFSLGALIAIGIALVVYGFASFLGLDSIGLGKHSADGRDTMAPVLFLIIGGVMLFYAIGELVVHKGE